MNINNILSNVNQYYTQKIQQYGATAQGVDWNSLESQYIRFEQLLKVCNLREHFSLMDYGCGYGALLPYMVDKGYQFKYYGFDISKAMINQAKINNMNYKNCLFFSDESNLIPVDYSLASGIFNVKTNAGNQEWVNYIITTLHKINSLSNKGFSFNILTKYSDPEYMRSNLYYADPCYFFDYCKQNFSRNVALLHDYNLYEFTIIVKKYNH